jgi:outer membrane protein OmpA-like peptidoglycan-associated protein
VKTDENGQFTFDKNEAGDPYVVVNVNYNILVEGSDEVKVNAAKDAFTTMGETSSKKFIKDFYVKIVTPETVWRLPEVRYDYDKDILQVNDSVNSKDSLNFLYDLMIENPTWVVQLRSHTDCRGSDTYNEDLSFRRAKACVKYLTEEKGIDTDRIVPVGMGKREAIAGLECDAINKLPTKQEQEAAHQRNRRTDFKVIGFDFVPKPK